MDTPVLRPAGQHMFRRDPPEEIVRRLPRLLLGLVLCGTGVAVMVIAGLGLGPWDVLHQGLSKLTGIPIGTVGIAVGVVVLLGWLPLHERIGVGTALNIVVIGVVIDIILAIVAPPTSEVARIALMLMGPVLFAVGSGFYIGAYLGPGPRDGVMTGIAALGPKVWVVRGGIEVTVLALGWALGGTVGIGTVWFALGIGPMVHLALHHLSVDPADPADPTEPITAIGAE